MATIFNKVGPVGENGISSKCMMTTFIRCFEREMESALRAYIKGMGPHVGKGEGFPGEVRFEIFQVCLELLLSGGPPYINVRDQVLFRCTSL